ncbi:hypothetical protein [Streptodolium elevatio]
MSVRTAVVVVTAWLLLGVTGCTASNGTSSSAASAAGPEASTPPPRSGSAGTGTPSTGTLPYLDCGDALEFTSPDPAAAPYAGPPPHLTVGEATSSLPREWVAYDKARTRWDWEVPRAQLLVCETGVRKRGDTLLRECTDTIPNVDLYAATYTFTVYELKTGRQVAAVEIDSDSVDPKGAAVGCPAAFTYQVGQGAPSFYQAVSEETLTERLRPLVMAAL